MTEKTKFENHPPTEVVRIKHTKYFGSTYGVLPGWSDRIQYQTGPKTQSGHLVWKQCNHTVVNRQQGTIGTLVCRDTDLRYDVIYFGTCPQHVPFPSDLTPPSGGWDRGTVGDILKQVDLNCKDSVLLYSGVLQAIPLLGGCFRFNRIMRDVVRHVKRGLLHQPFTTVVKGLISADFIDRFVIQPTLDDAKKFQDATDYVLRVMNTAYERDMAPVGLQATRTATTPIKSSSFAETMNSDTGFVGDCSEYSQITSKAFMKLQVHYDTQAIDPIKLWASRVGLTKPLESAWDLVPFSFVIDYFTRAGDFVSRLSEEMDAQEALKGRISKIYDLWGSCKREHTFEAKATGYTTSWFDRAKSFLPGTLTRTSYVYDRFPVSRPWTELSQFKGEDGFFNVDLSKTRLRTLAELVIQAKL